MCKKYQITYLMKFKIFRYLVISITLLTSTLLINSCTEGVDSEVSIAYTCPMDCENGKTYTKDSGCPICGMHLKPQKEDSKIIEENTEIPSASIFNLTSKWNTQNNKTIELKELKGDVLVVVMIYTTCQAACPRLVADMRSINEKVKDPNVKYVLVSIDPTVDTPEQMKKFAIENEMDNDQWVFLQGKIDDVREFSNVLSVKYKQISPLDFSHSNIISVFDENGVLQYQQEGLGVSNDITISKIKELK